MAKNPTIAASIGELSLNLPAVTKAKKTLKKAGAMTKATAKEINAVAEYQLKPYGEESLAYMPSQLVQCCFPHDDPRDVPEWSRSTPWLTVSFQPGYKTDRKTKQRVCVGYPYGTIPRLLMFYVMTEIQFKKNRGDLTPEEKRTVRLGDSLGQFMRNIGLNPDNGSGRNSDRKRLRSQVERFMRVRVSFDAPHETDDGYEYDDMLISDHGEFWWSAKDEEQSDLFESYIVLSEKFYQRILKTLVPLDMEALSALKNSALHLDLYAWCLYKAHTLRKAGKTQGTVEWRSFMMQSGANYARIRKFREKVIAELAHVRPWLRFIDVEADHNGITVKPSRVASLPSRPAALSQS